MSSDSYNFVSQAKNMIIVFLVAGVIGLVYTLIDGELFKYTSDTDVIDWSLNEDRTSLMRVFLSVYEFFWLFVIAFAFYKLSKKAGTKATEDQKISLEEFEGKFMKIMVTILIFAAIATLLGPLLGAGLPQYNTNSTDYEQKVMVEAHQFYFMFKFEGDANFSTTITLKEGVSYMFDLYSADTTHGFGLYNPGGVFEVQAQIVPGDYHTNLLYTLGEAGEWTVRCMEYCSVGHHAMVSTITVEA